MNKLIDKKQAIDYIQNNDTVMIVGFTNFGSPLHLMYELAQRDIRDLTIISEDLGYGGMSYDQGQGVLLSNGQVKEAIVSFVGGYPLVNQLVEQGKLKLTLVPQGTLAERIRAGGAGIGGFYTPTGVGTVVEEGKETRVIDGKKYLFEKPLRANVALVKAWKADTMGNTVFKYTAANFNPLMAMAADIVILEAEEVVQPGKIEPDHVQLPGVFVDYVVLAKEVVF